MTKGHLDLAATASGLAIDQANPISAVLSQSVFGVAHEQHVGEDQ